MGGQGGGRVGGLGKAGRGVRLEEMKTTYLPRLKLHLRRY